ncbi:hypothetical protein BT69DRAFT_1350618 [Atractiella rhizophila]|nr:hypothetical protein BT69DRAFT_1350618 [Atractiella rhizophila]
MSTVIVDNLVIDATVSQLKKIFEASAGAVNRIRFFPHKEGERTKYGEVQFKKPESAETAVRALNNLKIFGIPLIVHFPVKPATSTEDTTSHFKVVVEGLTTHVDEEVLTVLFSSYQEHISSISLSRDERSGQSLGKALVTFRSEQRASEAIRTLNKKPFCGSSLALSWFHETWKSLAEAPPVSNAAVAPRRLYPLFDGPVTRNSVSLPESLHTSTLRTKDPRVDPRLPSPSNKGAFRPPLESKAIHPNAEEINIHSRAMSCERTSGHGWLDDLHLSPVSSPLAPDFKEPVSSDPFQRKNASRPFAKRQNVSVPRSCSTHSPSASNEPSLPLEVPPLPGLSAITSSLKRSLKRDLSLADPDVDTSRSLTSRNNSKRGCTGSRRRRGMCGRPFQRGRHGKRGWHRSSAPSVMEPSRHTPLSPTSYAPPIGSLHEHRIRNNIKLFREYAPPPPCQLETTPNYFLAYQQPHPLEPYQPGLLDPNTPHPPLAHISLPCYGAYYPHPPAPMYPRQPFALPTDPPSLPLLTYPHPPPIPSQIHPPYYLQWPGCHG